MLQREEMSVSDKVPLIVPPLMDKTRFLQHESLQRMWVHAGLSRSS